MFIDQAYAERYMQEGLFGVSVKTDHLNNPSLVCGYTCLNDSPSAAKASRRAGMERGPTP